MTESNNLCHIFTEIYMAYVHWKLMSGLNSFSKEEKWYILTAQITSQKKKFSIFFSDSSWNSWLFVQEVLIKHLPCAKHSSRLWEYINEQNRQKSLYSWRLHIWRQTIKKKINNKIRYKIIHMMERRESKAVWGENKAGSEGQTTI